MSGSHSSLLLVVSAIYVYVGCADYAKSPWWLAFWTSYAMANVFYLKATGAL